LPAAPSLITHTADWEAGLSKARRL